MNLQQLNQSGQTIRSFPITAISALLITGFMWFGLEQFNSVMEWRRKFDDRMGWKPRPRDSIVVRVVTFLGYYVNRPSIIMHDVCTCAIQPEAECSPMGNDKPTQISESRFMSVYLSLLQCYATSWKKTLYHHSRTEISERWSFVPFQSMSP